MAFTKSQLEAIKSTKRTLAITAGAGSGKTSVLIERVIECVKNRDVPLSKILAITFTDKAATELKSRLIKVLGDPLAVSTGYISTFHSLCTRMLREGAPLLGLDPDFSVLDEGSARIILRQAVKGELLRLLGDQDAAVVQIFDELELRDAEELMEELISYRWHTEKMVARASNDPFKTAIFETFKKVRQAYDRQKCSNLDFNDLEIFTLKLLGIDDVRTRYQERFKFIFIDEFQDINDTQAELVSKIFNPSKNSITFVGDPKQSIYRFRGANVAQFAKAFDEAEHKVTLQENWRSAPNIIEIVNQAFPDFEPLVAGKDKSQSKVVELLIESPEKKSSDELREAEAKAVAEVVAGLNGSVACLFSSLGSIQTYCRELSAKGIPHVVAGGFGFFELDEIIDILSLLKAATDKTDIVSLLALCRSNFIGMTDEEIYLTFRQPQKHCALPPSAEEIVNAVWNHKKASILSKVEKSSAELTCSELIAAYAPAPLSDNVAKLINMAASLESREGVDLKNFISYCNDIRSRASRVAEYPSAQSNAVQIMTVHKAKGLEFDNVVLCDLLRTSPNDSAKWRFIRGEKPDIELKRLPENNPIAKHEATEEFTGLDELNKNEDKLERERLLYVAMTRAKHNLIVPLHKNARRKGEWHKRMEEILSKFAAKETLVKRFSDEEISAPAQFEFAKQPTQIKESKPADASKFTTSKTVYTTSEIEAYARCPMEYYLKYDLCVPSSGSLSIEKNGSLPANVRGDVVHRMIELASKILPAAEFDKCGLLEAVLIELGVNAGESEKHLMLAQFDRFVECGYLQTQRRMNEVPFILKIQDKTVNGKLDMMILHDDTSWEIVDFKTGDLGTNKEEAIKKYDLQIRTYGTAISGLGDFSKNGKVTLLFLGDKSATNVSSEINSGTISKTTKEIEQIIRSIEENKFAASRNPPCRTCAFNINKTCWERK